MTVIHSKAILENQIKFYEVRLADAKEKVAGLEKRNVQEIYQIKHTIHSLKQQIKSLSMSRERKYSFIDNLEGFIENFKLDKFEKSKLHYSYSDREFCADITFAEQASKFGKRLEPDRFKIKAYFGRTYEYYFDAQKYVHLETEKEIREQTQKEILGYVKIIRNSWIRSLQKDPN